MPKKKIEQRTSRILVRIIDKDIQPTNEIDETGRLTGNKVWKTKWVEVKEINLGSSKVPNKEIIEFKIEPIEIEPEEREHKVKSFKDMFDGVF